MPKFVSLVVLCVLLLLPAIAFAQNGNVGSGVSTPGRLWATIDAAVGLISAIVAGFSLARSRTRPGPGAGRHAAIVAGILGLIVVVYALLHLTVFTGAFGTGSGRAGAIVAIVLGLTSTVLAGITLTRSRRLG